MRDIFALLCKCHETDCIMCAKVIGLGCNVARETQWIEEYMSREKAVV